MALLAPAEGGGWSHLWNDLRGERSRLAVQTLIQFFYSAYARARARLANVCFRPKADIGATASFAFKPIRGSEIISPQS